VLQNKLIIFCNLHQVRQAIDVPLLPVVHPALPKESTDAVAGKFVTNQTE
jgi:hypothetical protein